MDKKLIESQIYLSLTDKEFEIVKENLNTFLKDFLVKLRSYPELKSENFKRLNNVIQLKNRFRKDEVHQITKEERERLFQQFPLSENHYLCVPKIL